MFSEQLNAYMEELELSGKELSKRSGISQAVISRYRKGERYPAADSEAMRSLAGAIALCFEEKRGKGPGQETILETLTAGLPGEEVDIAGKLDQLIRGLNLNVSRMSAKLHYDASFLAKIRQGKRKPADVNRFCHEISMYVADSFKDENGRQILGEFIGSDLTGVSETDEIEDRIMVWFHAEPVQKNDYIRQFLDKMDEFDLDQYIRAIQFDKLKVPTAPFALPSSRHYFGLEEMRTGELDFLKATVLSRSRDPLYLCCDMPVEDMAEDVDFAKKYMFGLAMVLKKGLHINIIHNVDRPMEDMMLGLENWIPLYMTGQITPRYLKDVQTQVYQHLHYLSGGAAMTGECVAGSHAQGHYYLTNNKTELGWMKSYMSSLFKKSHSLMDIYREEQSEKLRDYLKKESERAGTRRRILSAPPCFVQSEEWLSSLLRKRQISENSVDQVMRAFARQKERMERILSNGTICDNISLIPEECYASNPVELSIPGDFLPEKIVLSYEEYTGCVEAARCYAGEHENYSFTTDTKKGYHNIQISIFEGRSVMISKAKAPAIHFVIHHPKLVYAFENLLVPIVDE